MSKLFKVGEMNSYMSNRCGQGTPHNIGIKSKAIVEQAGHEMKENPPKVLTKTAKKSGVKKMKKQKVAIMPNKAKEKGAKIPKKLS